MGGGWCPAGYGKDNPAQRALEQEEAKAAQTQRADTSSSQDTVVRAQ